jgi:hypothetical protein
MSDSKQDIKTNTPNTIPIEDLTIPTRCCGCIWFDKEPSNSLKDKNSAKSFKKSIIDSINSLSEETAVLNFMIQSMTGISSLILPLLQGLQGLGVFQSSQGQLVTLIVNIICGIVLIVLNVISKQASDTLKKSRDEKIQIDKVLASSPIPKPTEPVKIAVSISNPNHP